MKTSKIFIILSLAVLTILVPVCLSQASPGQTYRTIKSRTSSVKESCTGINRMDINSQQSQSTSETESFLRSYFGLDGAKIIRENLAGNDEASSHQLNSNFAPIIMLILPFAVAAIILVAIAPLLICCCCCRPWCFRSLKFWQRDDQYWTWRELKIPFIIATILILGIMVACFFGFIEITQLSVATSHSICSRAIVFDDLLNGNVSDHTGNYWIGLQSFQNTIPTFLQQFSAINSTVADTNSNSGTIKIAQQQLGQTVTLITNIPAGTGKALNLAYPSPINVEKPKGLIRSTFPVQLGSVIQPSSLIGLTYADIKSAKDAIDNVAQISDYYMELSGPSTHQIGIVQNEVEASIVEVYNLDTKLQQKIKQSQDIPYWMTIGSYVLFSLLLVFCTLALISNLCMAWKNRLNCRFLSYIAIGGLFLSGLLAFALTLTSTFAVPTGLFLCDFVSSSASNSENFKQNFRPLIKDQKTLIGLSECVPSSTGTFLNYLAGDGLIKSMEALPKAVGSMETVKAQARSAQILDNFDKLETAITDILYAKKIDINDQKSIAIIDKLSKSYEWGCVANGFHEDSWIPALQQSPQVIPCKFGVGAVADHTTCSMGDDFQQRAIGCVGCMDTSALFRYTDQRREVLNALTKRYKGDNCGVFIGELSNVWDNYYRIKESAVGPILQRYETAKSTVKIGVETLNRDISPLFDSVIERLQVSAPDFMHPKYGVGAGLSCKVVGQDMQMLSDNVCNRMLPQMYVMMVIFGVTSFGILFVLCFLTCTTVRHYDQFVKEQQDQQGNQVGSQSEGQEQPAQKAKTRASRTKVPASSSRQILDQLQKQAKQENNSNQTQPRKALNLRQNFKTYNDRWRFGRRRNA